MMWFFLSLLVLALLAAVVAIILYNRLVASRQRVSEAWSGIDVQLKRRRNLIPNLVETVKGYLLHESSVLDDVTRTRARAAAEAEGDNVARRAEAEGQLGSAIARVFALTESYPELRASENFQDLQESLEEIEYAIQNARRYYNGAVRDLNVKVQSVPSNLVARRFGFAEATYFELDSPAERDLPKVDF